MLVGPQALVTAEQTTPVEVGMRVANSELIQITEDTITEILLKCGGRRAHPKQVNDGQNADYLIDDMIVELKCLDVDLFHLHKELALKELRHLALELLSDFIEKHRTRRFELHISIERFYRLLSTEQQLIIDEVILNRARKLASKAASQIESTKKLLNLPESRRCLWIVNNNNIHISGLTLSEEPGETLATKIANSSFSKTSRLDFIFISNGMLFKNDTFGDAVCLWSSHGFERGKGRNVKPIKFTTLQNIMPNLCSAHLAIVNHCMSAENFLFRQAGNVQRNATTDAWVEVVDECIFYYGYEDEWGHPTSPFYIKPL